MFLYHSLFFFDCFPGFIEHKNIKIFIVENGLTLFSLALTEAHQTEKRTPQSQTAR